MAFRGLLEATGVIPLSAVPTSVPGLRIGQEAGVWVTGKPSAATPGLYALQATGVWITGAALELPSLAPGGKSVARRRTFVLPSSDAATDPHHIIEIAALLALHLNDE